MKTEEIAPLGKELRMKKTEFLSKVDQPMLMPEGKWNQNTTMEDKMNIRPDS